MKILMVCLGNICRSPLAEGIMQHKAAAAGLSWTVESAGTGGWHAGEPPHRLSQKTARHYGIDISSQRARRFRPEDMTNFDLVFFMERQNLEDARSIAGTKWQSEKAALILNEVNPGADEAVPDPYYGDEGDYHHVFRLLSEACDAFIEKQLNPSSLR